MIQLALIRHGHTHWNREGRIQGRTDIPLDAEAEQHLSGLRLPAAFGSYDLVSSPLLRAARTAELIAGRAATPVSNLTEMDWGDWEGKKGVDLLATPGSGYRHIEDWGWDFRPPNGESPAEVRDRLEPWVAGLTQDTVAVCHIGIMRVLMAKASGWAFSGAAPFRIKRDRLFCLNIDAQNWRVDGEPVRLETRK